MSRLIDDCKHIFRRPVSYKQFRDKLRRKGYKNSERWFADLFKKLMDEEMIKGELDVFNARFRFVLRRKS